MHVRFRLLAVAAVAVAIPCLSLPAGASPAARGCGPSGYAYAGVQARVAGNGISATVAALAEPLVERGHVAAWVGVGAPDEGPGATAEWLQVGLGSEPGNTSALYYELTRPGHAPTYVELDSHVAAGVRHRLAVLEVAGRPNVWRVWVDGRAASRPIFLPASHRRLTPMAIAESWDGGAPACNRYAFRFGRVSLASSPGGAWRTLQDVQVREDPGYRVVADGAGFLALTDAPDALTALAS